MLKVEAVAGLGGLRAFVKAEILLVRGETQRVT